MFVYNIDCLFTDVLALAASIAELTLLTRQARTAMWCALQISGRDRPSDVTVQTSIDQLETRMCKLRNKEARQQLKPDIDLAAIEASND